MKTRFDLEQEIMQCWNVVDDLGMLKDRDQLTSENIGAIIALYSVKFDMLFATFEDCVRARSFDGEGAQGRQYVHKSEDTVSSVAEYSEN